MILALASLALLATQTSEGGPRATDVAQVERDVGVAEGELRRIEEQYRDTPELFSSEDRSERQTWGEIYYLTREYQRASFLLFGAIEPRPGDTAPVERQPGYADALYYLADSLYLLDNHAAAQTYFEKLLELPNHAHREQAVLRLMEIAGAAERYDLVDSYYEGYLRTARSGVPGQVRYLRGKSLFFAKKDDAALAELAQVPPADAYALRSRYMMGAVNVKGGDLETALQRFTEVAFAKPIAKGDRQVKELAHLARGRLLYELDRLGESIDAYQEIPYDSPSLTTMLYEVSWTYVRRGQLALRGSKDDKLTDTERRALARVEYEKALDQLDDLKALDPDSDRAAEIDVLAGNLRLQQNEFDKALKIFSTLLEQHAAADRELQALMAERSTRDRLLADILAMSSGGLNVDSKLPSLAARRVASNEDVAQALAVFTDIQKSKDDVTATTRLLAELEAQLSPENPSRTELFKPLQAAVERSTSLANILLAVRARAIGIERTLARPTPELAARLAALRSSRQALEGQIAALPQTREAVVARKKKYTDILAAIERQLHQAEMEANRRRAELTAIDFMVSRDPASRGNPVKAELRRNQVREARAQVEEIEARVEDLRGRVARLAKDIPTMGGRGSGEERLRDTYARTFEEERALLAQARDGTQAPLYARIDAALQRVDGLQRDNSAFRQRLDELVERRLTGARQLLAGEREALTAYLTVIETIDARASEVRDRATEIALERVRADLSGIVLRADVGVVDTSFARKQAQTEKIGELQRARAAELTDLTQAYADLTKDEAP